MIRLDVRMRYGLAVLWFLAICTSPAVGQQAKMSLDDDLQRHELSRMSLDDVESVQQTARMNLDEPAVNAETARLSLEDLTLSSQMARMRLDDSILSSPLAEMSLDDDELISDRVRLSFATTTVPSVSAHYQKGAGALADCLCSGTALPQQWLKAGYVMMWTKASRVPALVTRSEAADAGILGRPTTSIVFGDVDIDGGYRNGLRLNYGHRLGLHQEMAFEVDYFSAFDDTKSGDYYGTSASGGPVLARPFFNPTTNLEDSRLIGAPGVSEGRVGVFNTSESHSVALLLRNNYRTASDGRIDILSGYRHFRYRDGIYIHENRVTPIPGGTMYDGHDWFRSENEFNGGELGVHSQFNRGPIVFDVLAKIAIGAVRHNTLVDGRTTTTIPGAFPVTTFSEGGLLSAPSNIYRHTGSTFAALPELGVSATVPLTRSVSLQAGYSFLWLDNVIRAADLIDRRVNPTQLLGGTLSGAALPAPQHTDSDFWMQGVNFMLLIEG